jgi:hypothetical protein
VGRAQFTHAAHLGAVEDPQVAPPVGPHPRISQCECMGLSRTFLQASRQEQGDMHPCWDQHSIDTAAGELLSAFALVHDSCNS